MTSLSVFSPNRNVSKGALRTMLFLSALFIFLFWLASPLVFLPTMGETFKAFGELWHQGIAGELVSSLISNMEALGLASLISLVLAYTTVTAFGRMMVEFISKLRFLSMVGLSFFFTVLASNQHQLKLSLLVFSVTVFFVTSMADVVANVPKQQFDLARTLRMSDWHMIWEVVVLGQADQAFDCLRQNAAISWMMLPMFEGMTRSDGGIGAMLLNANKHFYLPAVMAIQISILLLGLGQDYMIGFIKNTLCPYSVLAKERK